MTDKEKELVKELKELLGAEFISFSKDRLEKIKKVEQELGLDLE